VGGDVKAKGPWSAPRKGEGKFSTLRKKERELPGAPQNVRGGPAKDGAGSPEKNEKTSWPPGKKKKTRGGRARFDNTKKETGRDIKNRRRTGKLSGGKGNGV